MSYCHYFSCLTAFPLFLNSLTSLISNSCAGSLELWESLGPFLQIKNRRQEWGSSFCIQEGPTGSCSVSLIPSPVKVESGTLAPLIPACSSQPGTGKFRGQWNKDTMTHGGPVEVHPPIPEGAAWSASYPRYRGSLAWELLKAIE